LEAVLQDFLHPQFRRENKDILFVSVYEWKLLEL
jgi:hypothetical protein